MLIDDVTIKVRGGKGGRGAVAFNRNAMALGPAGGNGGNGGSVVLEGVSDLNALEQFRYQKEAFAEDGGPGRAQFVDGPNGKDLVLRVPVGTVVHNLTDGLEREIVKIGERLTVARGGEGGKGNYLFRSSRDTSPERFQSGLPGQAFDVRLELKLIADVGFVGLPNVGKSSLLNTLTNAKSKVANYLFTTLEPHLGAYYDLILADIPGLIEGASEGKGLGIKFLRHVERTRILFHFVAADSEDVVADYQTIRQELQSYNPELAAKPEYVFLSRADTIDEEALREKTKRLKALNPQVAPLSIIDDTALAEAKKILNRIADEKRIKQ